MAPSSPRRFPTWQTITIGGETPQQLAQKFSSPDFSLSGHSREMLLNLDPVALAPIRTIKLGRAPVCDFGFTADYTSHEDFCAKMKKLGCDLCPPETGYYLLLDLPTGRKSYKMYIAMPPIPYSKSKHPSADKGILRIGYDGGPRWIEGRTIVSRLTFWSPGDECVFLLP